MNCNACPFQKKIDALRRRCLACNPDDDAGMPHGRVKADEFTLNVVKKPVDFCRTPSEQATCLAPEQEHKLRMAMSSLFALDPIDLLLVQHLMQQRSLESFAEVMGGVAERVRNYHGSPRAMAWARKEKLIAKLPQFRAVITNATEEDAAHRIANEMED